MSLLLLSPCLAGLSLRLAFAVHPDVFSLVLFFFVFTMTLIPRQGYTQPISTRGFYTEQMPYPRVCKSCFKLTTNYEALADGDVVCMKCHKEVLPR